MSRLPGFLAGLAVVACGSSDWAPDDPVIPELAELQATVTIAGTSGPATVSCTVRSTDAERSIGLMHVKEALGDNAGMLFVMDTDKDHSFWMANTYIPLDMLFIDVHGNVVGVLEEVQPLTRKGRSVGAMSRYVLEVDGGWSRRHGVFSGQQAEIRIAGARDEKR